MSKTTTDKKSSGVVKYVGYALAGLILGAAAYYGYQYFFGEKTVAALPGEKKEAAGRASWNCIKNPTHPACKEPMMNKGGRTPMMASWYCKSNPNDPKCKEPMANVTMTMSS